MANDQIDRKQNERSNSEIPSPRDLLLCALSGHFCADQPLEKIIDHLEKAQ
ncbi:MAG: hypothetical protein ABJ360_04065 [Roseobacter sp.]